MTTQRRSSSRRGSRAPRRKMDWDTVLIDPTTIAAGAQGVTDMTAGFFVGLRKGLTVVRIIGSMQVRSGTAGAEVEWVAGISLVRREPAGASVFPDPATDGSHPWMWWKRGVVLTPAGDRPQNDIPIDVKAQRKFTDAGDTLQFILDNDDSASSVIFSFGLRVLYKLP